MPIPKPTNSLFYKITKLFFLLATAVMAFEGLFVSPVQAEMATAKDYLGLFPANWSPTSRSTAALYRYVGTNLGCSTSPSSPQLSGNCSFDTSAVGPGAYRFRYMINDSLTTFSVSNASGSTPAVSDIVWQSSSLTSATPYCSGPVPDVTVSWPSLAGIDHMVLNRYLSDGVTLDKSFNIAAGTTSYKDASFTAPYPYNTVYKYSLTAYATASNTSDYYSTSQISATTTTDCSPPPNCSYIASTSCTAANNTITSQCAGPTPADSTYYQYQCYYNECISCPATTTVSGKVSTTGGDKLSGVVVNDGSSCANTPFIGKPITDSSGNFSLANVPAGGEFCLQAPAVPGYNPSPAAYQNQVPRVGNDSSGVKLACLLWGNTSNECLNDLTADNQFNFTYTPDPPANVRVTTPSCISGPEYGVNSLGAPNQDISISWTNSSIWPVTWTDIGTDASFNTYYHKQIFSRGGSFTSRTGAPYGFGCFQGSCLANPSASSLVVYPGSTYYVRAFDGLNSTPAISFSIPSCPAGPTATPTPGGPTPTPTPGGPTPTPTPGTQPWLQVNNGDIHSNPNPNQ